MLCGIKINFQILTHKKWKNKSKMNWENEDVQEAVNKN